MAESCQAELDDSGGKLLARSAIAQMVRLGLTPKLACTKMGARLPSLRRSRRARIGAGLALLIGPVPPVFPEQFHRVGRPNGTISATQIVGKAVFLAATANAFGILRGVGNLLRFDPMRPAPKREPKPRNVESWIVANFIIRQ